MTLTILRETEGWIAIDKPAHALVIPGRGDESALALREQLSTQLGQKLWVVHRLDRDTTGVLLFAKNARAHRALSMAFEANRIEKRYLAIVSGVLPESREIKLALTPARRGRMRPVKPNETGKEATTLVARVEALRDATLVEARPQTGRTHQIRVHLAAIGHPLVVDHQYGAADPLRAGDEIVLERTPLHAAAIEIPALDAVTPAQVEAPLPADMHRALELLRR